MEWEALEDSHLEAILIHLTSSVHSLDRVEWVECMEDDQNEEEWVECPVDSRLIWEECQEAFHLEVTVLMDSAVMEVNNNDKNAQSKQRTSQSI